MPSERKTNREDADRTSKLFEQPAVDRRRAGIFRDGGRLASGLRKRTHSQATRGAVENRRMQGARVLAHMPLLLVSYNSLRPIPYPDFITYFTKSNQTAMLMLLSWVLTN